jgi:hypothetical protein
MIDDDYNNGQAEANTQYRWDKNVYLFVYLVYGRAPPSWCKRDIHPTLAIDIGVPGTSLMSPSGDDGKPSAKKRVPVAKSDDSSGMHSVSFNYCQEEREQFTLAKLRNDAQTELLVLERRELEDKRKRARIEDINRFLLDPDIPVEVATKLKAEKWSLYV